MGMVSGVLVLMGVAKLGFFMIFGPFFFDNFFFDCFLNRFPTVSQPFSIVSDSFPTVFLIVFSDRSKCHENAKRTCSDFGFSG